MWEKRTEQRRPFTDFGDTNNGGDGTLIYRVDGKFVPSLRLRHLGDGMEDLQYIGLLESMTKKLDRKHGQARQAAGAALRRAESLLSERKKEYRKQQSLQPGTHSGNVGLSACRTRCGDVRHGFYERELDGSDSNATFSDADLKEFTSF